MELFRDSIGRLIGFVLLVNGCVFGQPIPVNWGPLESQPGQLLDILPIKSGDFHTLRYSGNVLGSYRSTLHNQLSFVSQKRIKPITENGIGNLETGTYFAGKLHVFISDKSNGTMSLYSQADRKTMSSPFPNCAVAIKMHELVHAQIFKLLNHKMVNF